jgi:hypothetical protein
MRTDKGGLSGRGIITEKPEDMDYVEAANRYYGGDSENITPAQTATDYDIEDEALVKHAKKQSEDNNKTPPEKPLAEIPEEERPNQ